VIDPDTSRPSDGFEKTDHGWCINCFRAFTADTPRYWFGSGAMRVGPFCEVCDRVIKVHTRF
jgi:hypothetical protein